MPQAVPSLIFLIFWYFPLIRIMNAFFLFKILVWYDPPLLRGEWHDIYKEMNVLFTIHISHSATRSALPEWPIFCFSILEVVSSSSVAELHWIGLMWAWLCLQQREMLWNLSHFTWCSFLFCWNRCKKPNFVVCTLLPSLVYAFGDLYSLAVTSFASCFWMFKFNC